MDTRKSLRRLVMTATAILLLAETSGSKAMAGGKQPSTPATVTVSPNVVPLNSTTVTISGSGYKPYQALIINTGMFPQPWINADGHGAFSIEYSPSGGFWAAGTGYVQVLTSTRNKLVVLATTSYVVQ